VHFHRKCTGYAQVMHNLLFCFGFCLSGQAGHLFQAGQKAFRFLGFSGRAVLKKSEMYVWFFVLLFFFFLRLV